MNMHMINHICEQLSTNYSHTEAEALAYWILEEYGIRKQDLLFLREGEIILPDLDKVLDRLNQHEPIQYIFGHTVWNGLNLKLSSATLIPRPETAELLSYLPHDDQPLHVLDIGTGSGCIALSIQKAHPTWHVTGVDISNEALQIARENALANQLDVTFMPCDILNENPGTYDIVISNPPYVCESEKKTMESTVLNYEPHTALFVPDTNPLLFYERIAALHIAPRLYFEINERMGAATSAMLCQHGYTHVQLYQDSYGKDRFICATVSQ